MTPPASRSSRRCAIVLSPTRARVAQWIRAFASGAKGRRFDPCRGYQNSIIRVEIRGRSSESCVLIWLVLFFRLEENDPRKHTNQSEIRTASLSCFSGSSGQARKSLKYEDLKGTLLTSHFWALAFAATQQSGP